MSLALIADADLVARCRQGDQRAWEELVNRFSRYVYAITSRVYRLSAHDAEDVFQDVFARVYTRLDTLRDDASIKPWIGSRVFSTTRWSRISSRCASSTVMAPVNCARGSARF